MSGPSTGRSSTRTPRRSSSARTASALPGIVFLRVPEDKTIKNRLHLDLTPDDQQTEVDRLIALGARPVDVVQGPEVTWRALADPEGNEFCVLLPKQTLLG